MSKQFDIRISANDRDRGWLWEVVDPDRVIVGRGLTATHSAARVQVADAIAQFVQLRTQPGLQTE